MITEPPFEQVIARLRAGHSDAAAEVFRRFAGRLIALADSRLDDRFRSKEDPEDVANSAYKSFFLRDGRSPYELNDWDGLWALLASITIHKCIGRRKFWRARKRDVAREFAHSPVSAGADKALWEPLDRGPTGEQATMLGETLDQFFAGLSEGEREILDYSSQEYSCKEVAERCRCSERTVRRVMAKVRADLLALIQEEDQDD
jgi:RNA polymerase sigma-70 factor (ECF subfamily)